MVVSQQTLDMQAAHQQQQQAKSVSTATNGGEALDLSRLSFKRLSPPRHYASRLFFAAARYEQGQQPSAAKPIDRGGRLGTKKRTRPWLGFGGLVTDPGGDGPSFSASPSVAPIGPYNNEELVVLSLREIDSLILAPMASSSSLIRGGGGNFGHSAMDSAGETEGINEEYALFVVAVHLEYIRNASLHRLRYLLKTAARAIGILLRLRRFSQVGAALRFNGFPHCCSRPD